MPKKRWKSSQILLEVTICYTEMPLLPSHPVQNTDLECSNVLSPVIPAAIQMLRFWNETHTRIYVRKVSPCPTPGLNISTFQKVNVS